MIYIDDGKTVKQFFTNKKTEKAIITLLEQIEDTNSCETHEGYKVQITSKEDSK